MTKVLNENGYDTVAINLRGCSGEPNRLLCAYHSGKTEDVEEVIHYIQKSFNYGEINVVGFSLGGNLTLKYVGEQSRQEINAAVAVSVPEFDGDSERSPHPGRECDHGSVPGSAPDRCCGAPEPGIPF